MLESEGYRWTPKWHLHVHVLPSQKLLWPSFEQVPSVDQFGPLLHLLALAQHIVLGSQPALCPVPSHSHPQTSLTTLHPIALLDFDSGASVLTRRPLRERDIFYPCLKWTSMYYFYMIPLQTRRSSVWSDSLLEYSGKSIFPEKLWGKRKNIWLFI